MNIDLSQNEVVRSQLIGTYGFPSKVDFTGDNLYVATSIDEEGAKYGIKNKLTTGVAITEVKAGDTVTLCYKGICPIRYGETIETGDKLQIGDGGKAIKKTGDGFCIGIAMKDGVLNDIGAVVLK